MSPKCTFWSLSSGFLEIFYRCKYLATENNNTTNQQVYTYPTTSDATHGRNSIKTQSGTHSHIDVTGVSVHPLYRLCVSLTVLHTRSEPKTCSLRASATSSRTTCRTSCPSWRQRANSTSDRWWGGSNELFGPPVARLWLLALFFPKFYVFLRNAKMEIPLQAGS